MSNAMSDDVLWNTWGRKHLREKGIKGVVGVVDDATAEMLRDAAGAGPAYDWGGGRTAADPDEQGIARILTSRIYQDLIGLYSDLMVFDHEVADAEAWDVLCDYFSSFGAARERLLLVRALPIPDGVPDENVVIIPAPERLTVEFLRQQIVDAPAR